MFNPESNIKNYHFLPTQSLCGNNYKLGFMVSIFINKGHKIPVINVHGVINSQCAFKVGQRLSKLNTTGAVALAVSVNSPGGSPVQSEIISNKIRDFAIKKNLKVYTFAQDMAASGGYYVLCTGREVYANRTSLVGSIGVLVQKTNLDGLLERTNLEFKEMYSSKDSLEEMMSPFKQLTEEQREKILKLCHSMHKKFINHVKGNRKEKLANDEQIFSGEVYSGEEGQKLGLVDGVGSMFSILEEKYPGCKIQVERKQNPIKRLLSF